MSLIKKIKWRIAMIKEIFTLKRKPEVDYFQEMKEEIFRLRERLTAIESKYHGFHYDILNSNTPNQFVLFDSRPEMPSDIKSEREEILRKLNTYCNQVGREYDREFINNRMFWYWFLR